MAPQGHDEATVPVALFVYRRHERLQRTLDCLRACQIKALYVFSDGAKGESDARDVAEVRALLRRIDWIEPVLCDAAANLGLSDSIVGGLNYVFDRHASAIVIEDDVCVAPEFYDYACQALRHYEGAEQVAGVTGLRYPFERSALDGHGYDVFLAPRFSSWGWATWRERWGEFNFEAATLRDQLAATRGLRPERAGADMPGMIEAAVVQESLGGSWDVFCAANMLVRDQHFVSPAWNMVENTGLSDGTHFDEAPPWELHWEPEHRAPLDALRFAPIAPAARVLRSYRRFFSHGDAEHGLLTRARLAAAQWRSRRRLELALARPPAAADPARGQPAVGVGAYNQGRVVAAAK